MKISINTTLDKLGKLIGRGVYLFPFDGKASLDLVEVYPTSTGASYALGYTSKSGHRLLHSAANPNTLMDAVTPLISKCPDTHLYRILTALGEQNSVSVGDIWDYKALKNGTMYDAIVYTPGHIQHMKYQLAKLTRTTIEDVQALLDRRVPYVCTFCANVKIRDRQNGAKCLSFTSFDTGRAYRMYPSVELIKLIEKELEELKCQK